ncbi:MAG: PKD domain-containing protein [Candidatus Schekmanbacteria bacterium]|nr:PKD domain-containing protein [Candidatus Schekmanbacteria bacterium]
MPDDWESANQLNPYNPNDANEDQDGDGLNNLAEYNNGSNPHHAPVIYYVDTANINDQNQDGSREHPYADIDRALWTDRIQADDIIHVFAGVYRPYGGFTIPPGVRLTGESWYDCAIELKDGQIYLYSDSTLSGFKISTSIDNHKPWHMIIAQNATSVTIANNVILGNPNFTEDSAPAAIFLENSTAQVVNNTIVGGHTGILAAYSEVNAINNIFADTEYPQSYIGNSNIMLAYNNLWNNKHQIVGKENNISANPLFVDTASGNYHLKSGSPCFDTGNPFAGYNNIDGSRNDIGADGGPNGMQDIAVSAVSASAVPMTGASPLQVDFTGIASDEWGIASWSWDFNMLTEPQIDSTAQNPSHVYEDCGGYIVKLTVTDNSGFSNSTTIENIIVGNPPEVTASSNPLAAVAGNSIAFNCVISEPENYTYSWDFGDGNTSAEQNPSHIYNANGRYKTTLVVTDGNNCQSPIVIPITILASGYNPTIYQAQLVKANTAAIVTVSNPGDKSNGVAVKIPAGALSENTVITICEMDENSLSPLPSGISGIGIAIDFGPDGCQFSSPVTITIPYTDDDLAKAGVTSPHALKVYYCDSYNQNWEELAIANIDEINKLIFIQTTHFTTYILAAEAPTPPNNLTATAKSAGQIDLSWTDNSGDEEFFSIERRTGGQGFVEIIKVGAGKTSYSDTDLTPDTEYCYRVLAIKASEFSDYSNEACATSGKNPAPPQATTSDGNKCFIATAAYGTPMAIQVKMLSQFRDNYLLTNTLGKYFVKFYYKYSPPIAEYIAQRDFLRILVRAMLWPLIGFSLFMLKFGLVEKLGIMIVLLLVVGYLIKRKRLQKIGAREGNF